MKQLARLFWKMVGFMLYQSFNESTIERREHNRFCVDGILVVRGLFGVYGKYPCDYCFWRI